MSMPSSPVAWTFERIILLAIVLAGAIGVALVLLNVFGIVIPSWMVTIGWIVVAVLIGVAAVKLIFRML